MLNLICMFKIKIKQFWTRIKNFTVRVSPQQKRYHISVHTDKIYEVDSCDKEFCMKVRQAVESEDEQQKDDDQLL